MTLENLYKLLVTLGIPTAYNHFKKPQEPPYLIYLFDGSGNFGADNKVYCKIDHLAIELYTTKKDIHLETKIEGLLEYHDLYYEKYEAYLDTENMYQVRYEI